MSAFYNEIDPFAAQWLRNLIAAGHLPTGVVDERSIEDIAPHELAHYTQCHFFAGIGGWPLALRMAGWPDDKPVWTGSCPCQPFSSAGKGDGFDDERHVWPAWQWLIEQCRPAVILGEQVASPAARQWLDLVFADLEGAGYACGAANLCAAGAGAPHIRQRLFWMANANWLADADGAESHGRVMRLHAHGGDGDGIARVGEREERSGRLANTGAQRQLEHGQLDGHASQPRQQAPRGHDAGGRDQDGRVADPCRAGFQARRVTRDAGDLEGAGQISRSERREPASTTVRGDATGAWADLEWIACSDGKARPAQPGIFPLAHGIPGRVGKLRAYGNAIVAPLAAEFVKSCR